MFQIIINRLWRIYTSSRLPSSKDLVFSLSKLSMLLTFIPFLPRVVTWCGRSGLARPPPPPHPNSIFPPSLRDFRWPGTKLLLALGRQPLRREGERQIGLNSTGSSFSAWWRTDSLLLDEETGGLVVLGSSFSEILYWSSSMNRWSSSMYLTEER